MKNIAFMVLTAVAALAQVPRTAPPLVIGGHNVLALAQRRPAIIAMVSTQCGHCAAAATKMQEMQKEFPGVFFGAVAFDDKADVAAWSKKLALTFPVFSTDRFTALKFLGLPDQRLGTPQMVYIDKAGVIRAQSERLGTPYLQTEGAMRSLLQALLKEKK